MDSGTHGNSSKLGKLLATCGPGESGMLHYAIIGIGCFLVGIGSFVAPFVMKVNAPAKDEQAFFVMAMIFGGVLTLLGLLMVILPLFGKASISLHAQGIARETRSKRKEYSWNEIANVELYEFFEHRNADRKLNVVVVLKTGKKIYFSSHFHGDAKKVIKGLRKIFNPSVVPFQP